MRKPEVVFDAENDDHRQMYHQFLKDKSWGRIPVKFKVPSYGNTLGMIEKQLIEFYSKKEFDSIVK